MHDDDFGDVVLGACGPVLVHLHSGRTPHPGHGGLVAVLDALATDLPWLTFVRLDVDRDPVTPAAYRVSRLPALLVFDAGEPVLVVVGSRPLERLRGLLETLQPV